MDSLSTSKIKRFLQCPRSFEDEYLMKNKGQPSEAIMIGKIYHEVKALDDQQKIESKKNLPVDKKFDELISRMDRAYWESETRWVTPMADLIEQLKSLIKLDHESFALHYQPLLVEHWFEVEIEGIKIVGIWDLVTADGSSIDHKVFSRTPSQSEVDKDIQLSIYSLGYRMKYGELENGLRFNALVKNKNPKAVVLDTSRTTEQLEWTAKMIVDVHSAIETGCFPPNPTGWWCDQRFCNAYDRCMATTL